MKAVSWGFLAGVFHQHLDACAQCRQHPFTLCPVGAKLFAKLNGPLIKEMQAIPARKIKRPADV